jgi:mxaK protein
MNKKLIVAKWLVLLLIIGSSIMVIHASYQLWQYHQIEAFVADPTAEDVVPDNGRAHFALAEVLEAQSEHDLALDEWTLVLNSEDKLLIALAYYNRGNINLREAQTMTASDGRQIPLVELAKQDYRSALAVLPQFWDARYNLEVALTIVSEDPEAQEKFEKKVVNSERSIESKAFKVDLP